MYIPMKKFVLFCLKNVAVINVEIKKPSSNGVIVFINIYFLNIGFFQKIYNDFFFKSFFY